MITPLTYVLITPARNEAESIERTIKSIIIQTHRPARWVIVGDGSTDGIDEIALTYCAIHEWTRFVRMPEYKERYFAGKSDALNAGYASVKDRCYVSIPGGTPHDSISENSPTKGSYEAIAGYPFPNTTSHVFSTPGTNADGAAWVLVLETQ